MPVKMSREQLEFWRELLAPFPSESLSVKSVGGRDLTYIDKRSLANRLDSVVGPTGWYPEYRDAGGRGLICKLFIRVPETDGSLVWMSKEDGGSDEEMTKKAGGQQIKDVDNSFKSELTNAFRRAAQDAWGIGRYLYQKGIPLFLDLSIPAEAICGETTAPAARSSEAPRQPAKVEPQCPISDPVICPSAIPDRARIIDPPPAVERIDMPPAGPDVFKWAKAMETRFRTNLVNGMQQGAVQRGLNANQMYVWPQEAVNAICNEAIDYIKSLETYKGEFDHVTAEAPAPVAVASPAPVPSAPAPPNTGDPLSAKKLELMTKIGSHIEKQLGVKPTMDQLKAGFQTVASECLTGAGHSGEVPDSLRDLTDAAWIANMIKLVDENIRRSTLVQPVEAAPEIPF